jgi:predicted MPP superfamily phosphohydrolase
MDLIATEDSTQPAHAPAPRLTRRRFLTAGAATVGISGTTTSAYAGVVEPFGLVVTRYAPAPAAWPADRKLSITVIADLHAGGPDMTLPHIRHVVDTAQALQSDLVVLLGDYEAWYPFQIEPVATPLWAPELARLKAPLGIWAILGNHDWTHNPAAVRAALADAQIPVLENDAVLVGAGTQRFWLAGLGDQIAHRPGSGEQFHGQDDLPGTLTQINSDDPVLLLAHEPDIFPTVPNRVALTLAGHTHGGQIRVPLIWPNFVPSKYGARYAYGHVVENDRHLIVSGGLGTSTIPARLGVPPEIVHVTLGA